MKKAVTLGLMACSGCHVAVVGLHEKLVELLKNVSLEHSYILMDSKTIPGNVDLAIVEGGVRTKHDEEKVLEARDKAKIVVALGSCACFGNIPSLCNLIPLEELLKTVYRETATTVEGFIPSKDLPEVFQKVRPINEVVKVDYQVPGCPPEADDIAEVLTAILTGRKPELSKKDVCDDCPRERKGEAPKELKRLHVGTPDPKRCLLEQGYVCVGPATMGGCKARCPTANVTCDGCRGPAAKTWDQGLAMLDALTAFSKDLTKEFKLSTHAAMFYRYTFASSILSKLAKEAGGK